MAFASTDSMRMPSGNVTNIESEFFGILFVVTVTAPDLAISGNADLTASA
jgi:hypothetical protein